MSSVISYEGSKYRTDFWEGQGRDYEDRVERIAIRRLVPPKGKRLLEIGAGFGRLTHEYDGYEQVVLLDYSRSLLEEAQAHLGKDKRFVYVAANIYKSPLADNSCDAATMVRVLHHIADVPAALEQIKAALAPNSTFMLEFANKRNLKAILRYLLRRQDWNPFSLEPVEFVELNFDFHPHYIYQALDAAGFDRQKRLAVSFFRLGLLKRTVPTSLLVKVDSLLQWTGAVVNIAPSVFTQNRVTKKEVATAASEPLFKCPACGSTTLETHDEHLLCGQCNTKWSFKDGIYDFREPLV